jgi:hypothetical protein
MRVVVINDGQNMQVDLIPECDHDEAVLKTFKEGDRLRVGRASGYAPCKGGYLRQFEVEKGEKSFVFITSQGATND